MGEISSEECASVSQVYGFRAANMRSDYVCQSLFLSFRRVLNVSYSFLGNSPASEF